MDGIDVLSPSPDTTSEDAPAERTDDADVIVLGSDDWVDEDDDDPIVGLAQSYSTDDTIPITQNNTTTCRNDTAATELTFQEELASGSATASVGRQDTTQLAHVGMPADGAAATHSTTAKSLSVSERREAIDAHYSLVARPIAQQFDIERLSGERRPKSTENACWQFAFRALDVKIREQRRQLVRLKGQVLATASSDGAKKRLRDRYDSRKRRHELLSSAVNQAWRNDLPRTALTGVGGVPLSRRERFEAAIAADECLHRQIVSNSRRLARSLRHRRLLDECRSAVERTILHAVPNYPMPSRPSASSVAASARSVFEQLRLYMAPHEPETTSAPASLDLDALLDAEVEQVTGRKRGQQELSDTLDNESPKGIKRQLVIAQPPRCLISSSAALQSPMENAASNQKLRAEQMDSEVKTNNENRFVSRNFQSDLTQLSSFKRAELGQLIADACPVQFRPPGAGHRHH